MHPERRDPGGRVPIMIEHGAVGPTGQRQIGYDLAVRSAENHHYGLRRLRRRIPGVRTRREEHMILGVQRQAVASALVPERIMPDSLHGLDIEAPLLAGGQAVPVLYAGSQNTFAGLDQVNIGLLPRSLAGNGKTNIVLVADGQTANPVEIAIQ